MLGKLEAGLREGSTEFLHFMEAVLYVAIGILLSIASLAALYFSGVTLWKGIVTGVLASSASSIIDQMLTVLVLVEVLHTVRSSARSQQLIMEPFLIVGMVASVRRVLVITMQAAESTKEPAAQLAFRNSMIELMILAVLIVGFVFSIWLLRRKQQESVADIVQ